MNTGGDLANIVANVTADVGKEAVKASGEVAKAILLMLINNARERSQRVKAGETTLQKLLDSGEEIRMADLSKKDLNEFIKKSKLWGISYAVISEDNKDTYSVLFKASEQERVLKVLENILEVKMMENEIEEDMENDVQEDMVVKSDKELLKGLDEDSNSEIDLLQEQIRNIKQSDTEEVGRKQDNIQFGNEFKFGKFDANIIFKEIENRTDEEIEEYLHEKYKDPEKAIKEYEIHSRRIEKLMDRGYIAQKDGIYSITKKGKEEAEKVNMFFEFTSYDANIVFGYIEKNQGKLSMTGLKESLQNEYNTKEEVQKQYEYLENRLKNNEENGFVEKNSDGHYIITKKGREEASKVSKKKSLDERRLEVKDSINKHRESGKEQVKVKEIDKGSR